MSDERENGKSSKALKWIDTAELLFWQEHQNKMLKIWAESRPKLLAKYGLTFVTGTKDGE